MEFQRVPSLLLTAIVLCIFVGGTDDGRTQPKRYLAPKE
jgi:hypothetical protein